MNNLPIFTVSFDVMVSDGSSPPVVRTIEATVRASDVDSATFHLSASIQKLAQSDLDRIVENGIKEHFESHALSGS